MQTSTTAIDYPFVETELDSVDIDADNLKELPASDTIGTSKIVFGRGLPESPNDQYFYVDAGYDMLYSYNTTYYSIVDNQGLSFPTPGKTNAEITGTPNVGEVLSVSDGSWSGGPDLYFYQWGYWEDSVWTDIASATANTYTVVEADLGHFVSCRVFAGDTVTSMSYYLLSEYHQADAVEIVAP